MNYTCFGLKSMLVKDQFYSFIFIGLGRLRDLLSLDGTVQPGRVLIHASEVIESAGM